MNKAVARRSPAESELPSVSVIIPTYNRKEELTGLLSSLEKQTLPAADFEIIVVDDGSADDTLFYLKTLVAGGKEKSVFLLSKKSGSWRSAQSRHGNGARHLVCLHRY